MFSKSASETKFRFLFSGRPLGITDVRPTQQKCILSSRTGTADRRFRIREADKSQSGSDPASQHQESPDIVRNPGIVYKHTHVHVIAHWEVSNAVISLRNRTFEPQSAVSYGNHCI